MVLQEPLDVSDFSKLTGIEVDVINRLQSQIIVICQLPSTAASLTTIYPAASIFHLSFLQFVQDQSAIETLSITLSLARSHATFGQKCLDATFVYPPHEQTLPSMPRRRLNAYRYAVKFWPLHVCNGTDRATWSTTTHCKQLLGVPTKAMRRWASSFAEYYQPKVTLDEQNFVDNRQATVLQGVAGGLAAVNSIQTAVDCLEVAVRLWRTSIPAWHQLGAGYRRLSEDVWDSDLQILNKAAVALQNALTIWETYSTNSPSPLPFIARAPPPQMSLHIPTPAELVSMPREELGLQSEIYELYPRLVTGLGSVLQAQFEQGSTNGDDDSAGREAISLYHHALQVPLGDQPESRCGLLYNIASVHYAFHARKGNEDDLNRAIEFGEMALRECPPNDIAHSLILRALGKFYRVSGNIQAAIEKLEDALNHCHNQEDKSIVLNEYSDALRARFESVAGAVELGESLQNLQDLDDAISHRKEALALCPRSHPSRSEILYRLGNDSYRRHQCNTSTDLFNQTDSKLALQESIRLYKEALELRIARDGRRFTTLTQLGVSLLDHVKERGGNVDEIISVLREALSFEEGMSIPNLERATCRETLAQALYFRWMNSAQDDSPPNERDLHEAISQQLQILDIESLGPPVYTNSLFNLAIMHESLYAKFNRPEDRIESLFNKAHAFSTRFGYSQLAGDLDEVVQVCEQLLEKIPPGNSLVEECQKLSQWAAETKLAIQMDTHMTLGTISE
jgi:tetratricopeptide (TPR) repeat protein